MGRAERLSESRGNIRTPTKSKTSKKIRQNMLCQARQKELSLHLKVKTCSKQGRIFVKCGGITSAVLSSVKLKFICAAFKQSKWGGLCCSKIRGAQRWERKRKDQAIEKNAWMLKGTDACNIPKKKRQLWNDILMTKRLIFSAPEMGGF